MEKEKNFKYIELFNKSTLGIALVDLKTKKILEVNQKLLELTEYTKEEFLQFPIYDIIELSNTSIEKEAELIKKDGSHLHIISTTFLLENEKNQNIACIQIEDITEKKELEIIYNDNKKLLKYIAIENSLDKTLNKIVDLAEGRNPEILCSILLLDEEGKHLLTGVVKSLPQFYNEAVNGIEIGENIGSCGSAAFKKERVIVENIDTHENWQDYLELTQKANLHACWSEPIISSNNKVLGTFAIYNNKPKKPTSFELRLIESYANLAASAIEKDQYLKIKYENDKKIEQIFNNTHSGLMYISKDRVILKVNQRLCEIFGYKTPDELIGLSTQIIHLNKDRFMKFGDVYFNDLIKNEKFNIEYQLRKKDDSPIWCELSGKVLDTQTPASLEKGVLWTINDISLRKKYKKELTKLDKSRRDLLLLFDKGESVLFNWEIHPLWKVNYVSSNVIKLFGYTKKGLLSKDTLYNQYIHEDDKERVEEEIKNAISKKLDYFKHQPYRILTKEKNIKWILGQSISQKDENGKITGFIGYITDISEQIKNQELIYHQSKIAAMGEMLGNISHQWRQPLSAISSLATGTKLKVELDILSQHELHENMELINEHAQYLSKTIDDFRSFFNTNNNQKNVINLKEPLMKAFSLVKDSFRNQNIETKFNLDDIYVYCNENIFIQAILNILNNARDAFKENTSRERFIFIDLVKDDKSCILSIKDNASGIPENIINKIFEPYFTTKHQSQGTGIGLYMTNQIINRHLKGEIKVENINFKYENKEFLGASFKIIIPI